MDERGMAIRLISLWHKDLRPEAKAAMSRNDVARLEDWLVQLIEEIPTTRDIEDIWNAWPRR